MSKKEEKKIDNKENSNNIEVVIGDDSILNISEVGDCMNQLRPKDQAKKRKKFIIPIAKKKIGKDDEE
ncbi:MAG: hypothetical protein IKL55_06370 [Clostridia bacterium]|nr:hypothetical protein [Clostridia bacterium]